MSTPTVLQIESEKLFSNICDVYYATCHFWVNHMSQVLRLSRETHEPLDPCLLKAGFLVVSLGLRLVSTTPSPYCRSAVLKVRCYKEKSKKILFRLSRNVKKSAVAVCPLK